MPAPLRLGTLGAAHMAEVALIRPARLLPDVEVIGVAARDPRRAEAFARRHGVPRAYQSYAALLDDTDIDAVYVPLPNSLHAPWAIRALQAGKHVLCEKPLAENAFQATEMANVAAASGRLLVEAFHYRYHPLAARLKTILDSGEIGQIRHVDTEFSVPLLRPGSIQYRYDLGGGATMDVGCYVINLLRFVVGMEPRVLRAEARQILPHVDRYMEADFAFADGLTARMICSLCSGRLFRATTVIHGDHGGLRVTLPFLPHRFHRLSVHMPDTVRHERLDGATTYWYQLRAFARAIRGGKLMQTDAADGVANMRVIDAVYQAAGLHPRGQADAQARSLNA